MIIIAILTTLNVDVFMCIHFRGFIKMGNWAWIKILISSVTGSSKVLLSHHK